MSDPRDEFIARVVRGRSFADVGGLWGTVNEKVSVAHAAGASALAMIDISERGDRWTAFEARCRQLGVPDVRTVQGDVQELVEAVPDLVFDVVHCSGVLYHLPEPLRLLRALRKAAREHVVFTSAVTATTISNAAGTLRIPDSAALFVPALSGAEREILRAHWEPVLGDGAHGITKDVPRWRVEDFGPWWWLPTPAALSAMCEAAGFRVLDRGFFWNDNAFTQLLAVA
jgi:SAM-dependent methyltransferase